MMLIHFCGMTGIVLCMQIWLSRWNSRRNSVSLPVNLTDPLKLYTTIRGKHSKMTLQSQKAGRYSCCLINWVHSLRTFYSVHHGNGRCLYIIHRWLNMYGRIMQNTAETTWNMNECMCLFQKDSERKEIN